MTSTPSGRFVLRVPPSLHRQLKRAAGIQAVSLNELCVRALNASFCSVAASSDRAMATLISQIEDQFGPALVGVILFGSAARGELTADSDIDLLVVVTAPIERSLYRSWDESRPIQDAARIFSRTVNPQFVRLPEGAPADAGSIWLEAAIDGKVLWERDGRLSHVLIQLRQTIAEGNLTRSRSHGHPYWIRRKNSERIG